AIRYLDRLLETISNVFLVLANLCLGLMLLGTFATIVLRLFGVSFYWIWPWTMQFFVWMSFVGFFVVYRLGKDIAVDFLVIRIGPAAQKLTRYAVPVLIIVIMAVMLREMPTIFESQVGVIDGVVTPWGELERYTLSVPLAVSCFLILLNAILDIMKAVAGLPEPVPSHLTDPDT
ncbi:MAG: TRAP transporter small permease, partial [Hyphomicrobiaceae bacterium]